MGQGRTGSNCLTAAAVPAAAGWRPAPRKHRMGRGSKHPAVPLTSPPCAPALHHPTCHKELSGRLYYPAPSELKADAAPPASWLRPWTWRLPQGVPWLWDVQYVSRNFPTGM